ncbi:ATP-binding cassette domain-containing protein [Bacteriovorax stolpii]|uniref:ABC transporter ATP-binding protein n=1 Tax=Bacteriovorax stolpii TaxID=960 RepID=A0A2K9NXV6_BACTC|nr:ABC-F family ATP-binding cassette domain-containing protein [Bacteriovorax stolpii]AUN99594.1 ABC transporter ATP-binding protein [Bacteriovorax stolpii]QDK40411.1 ATP-binding cassette domain-containing protein [Bacteriovorax stolpii]TDP51224.1 ATP-binding cassette subfamily F protein 3 [Bacteriovorax stolpii]
MIQAKNLSKHFGAQELFSNVSFQLGPRERVGLVGRNGSGKSTLFKLILGELSADGGEISIPKGYRLGALEQHIHFTKPTVLEECTQVLNPEDFKEHEAEKILFGLGFSEPDLARDPKSFSGGYQIRINLTKVLLQSPDLLLLDEPTNYLDIVSMRWLKSFLKNFPGEIMLITHDREFMDDVVTHTMGLHRQQLKKIKGDTAKFYEQILQDEEMYEKTRENLDKKRKEMEAFIERFKAKASKAAQAQSRVKALEKMSSMDKLADVDSLGFKFRFVECPGKQIAEVKHLSFHYEGKEENLFHNLSFPINREDRIGIIGKNGKGKSTLLNIIGGYLTPVTGKVSFHPSAQIGHFGQTNINRLNMENTIAEEIQQENNDLSISSVRNICGTMMFEGDLAKKKIKVLSGGERARVLLGKILAKPANLLLLDEPTNHLDMESIESLTEEIGNFPGAVVIVTHSEIMLKNLATKLVIFHNGNAEFFNGTYDDFLEKIGWESEETKPKVETKKLSEKEIKQKRAELTIERAKQTKPIKEEIERLEGEITKNEDLLKRINNELEKATLANDTAKLTDYAHAVGKLNHMIDELFEKLTNSNENLEFIQAKYDKELDALS